MKKGIIGGIITLIIGGTGFAISKTDVVNNFAKNSGLSQQQAQQYVNNLPQGDLESFSKVGQSFTSDGNSVLSQLPSIDCAGYTYQWQTTSLDCQDGYSQLQAVGNDEVTLGNCYEALGTDLGNAAKDKINECISDGDSVVSDYGLPIVSSVLDSKTIKDDQNTIEYDKSVLQAALNSQ